MIFEVSLKMGVSAEQAQFSNAVRQTLVVSSHSPALFKSSTR